MLSNDDIDRLLAIGEQQRAELLGHGSNHPAPANALIASCQTPKDARATAWDFESLQKG
jgi:hypothetical protein